MVELAIVILKPSVLYKGENGSGLAQWKVPLWNPKQAYYTLKFVFKQDAHFSGKIHSLYL